MRKYTLLYLMLIALLGCEKDPTVFNLPTITTGASTNISYSSAKVFFSIDDNSVVEESGIIWDTNSTLYWPNYSNSSTGVGSLSVDLNFLPSGTTIYYKAYAKDRNDNFIYGDVESFTTKYTSVKVTTGTGTYLGYNSGSTYPYGYSFSASLVGLSKISSWGIIVSNDNNLSASYSYYLSKSGYSQGSLSSIDLYWRFRDRVYFRAFAELIDGGKIYGDLESIY